MAQATQVLEVVRGKGIGVNYGESLISPAESSKVCALQIKTILKVGIQDRVH